jgi:serine/threonine protein kinase
MKLATDQVLQARYCILSMLGQGGMGAVYRARDTRLGIPVAIKEMTPQPEIAPHVLVQLRQQFQQEAILLARLDHPHLVAVTDFFEEDGNAYLVIKFIKGKSLAEHIESMGAIPEDETLVWADQLVDALAYCHAQGVIHRDVKPENVIIHPNGRAVLVDFGLVKLWDPGDPHTQTVMRGMGTPEYAPPEQYDAQTGHTDPRADIYSLGATLYHALTGQAPPTATQRIARRSAFQTPRSLNERISPGTEAAVLRAMELTVEDRFLTVQEMAEALRGTVPNDATDTAADTATGTAMGTAAQASARLGLDTRWADRASFGGGIDDGMGDGSSAHRRRYHARSSSHSHGHTDASTGPGPHRGTNPHSDADADRCGNTPTHQYSCAHADFYSDAHTNPSTKPDGITNTSSIHCTGIDSAGPGWRIQEPNYLSMARLAECGPDVSGYRPPPQEQLCNPERIVDPLKLDRRPTSRKIRRVALDSFSNAGWKGRDHLG